MSAQFDSSSELECVDKDGDVETVPRGGLDAPTGQFIGIPSSVTGRPIHYFIPDPLTDLLMRCGEVVEPVSFAGNEEIHAAAFLSLVARRGYAGVPDPTQAHLLFDLLWSPQPVGTVPDLCSLATRIGSRSQEIRRQIVFTGSRTASEAAHVYAPHEAVPVLMEQLANGIKFDSSHMSISDRVAVLGFFCIHAHPFRDGNGRWTRAVILTSERRSLLKTMAAMSFQTVRMKEVARSIWPQTYRQGLRGYLEVCDVYTSNLLSAFRSSTSFLMIQEVDKVLRRVSKDRLRLKNLSRQLFVSGGLEAGGEIRELLGVSSRVVDGLFRSLEDCGLSRTERGISMDSLSNEMTLHANAAAAFMSEETKERE